jgi:divalent metal cation (Fe/Co/Zn/Cd) transporter
VTNREALLRRGLMLEYVTLGWNIVEAGVVLYAAWTAGSVGMAGFGLDSVIEIFASFVVVWQLKGAGPERERAAMRLIGVAFYLLAAYIVAELVFALKSSARPAASPLGLASLAATVVAMSLLAWGKRVTGRQLGNAVLIAESRVTLMDAALASSVFVGVGLNTLFGWWWADPASGLVVLAYALKEGREAWTHADPEPAG